MISAIAVFDGQIKGTIKFIQIDNKVKVIGNLSGFDKDGLHGFHVHEYGDLSKGCDSACNHFNPYNTNHGGRQNSKNNRHVGDLGNIKVKNGKSKFEFIDNLISLKGTKRNIIGRSLIVHEDPDDLGLGLPKESSLKTGNSGKRIGCAIIGITH